MNISDLPALLNLQTVQGTFIDRALTTAYTSDLLSDVMGNAPGECAIITIQAHKNTVAVATLKDAPVIIICNGRPIPDDMIAAAKDEQIAIFLSEEDQFHISGALYNLLRRET